MNIFVEFNDGTLSQFSGMALSTLEQMLEGRAYRLIEESEYTTLLHEKLSALGLV